MATTTLKILREINNYTQEYVAEKILGVSQNTYSRMEQTPGRISAEQAQKLSELYNVSIANLLSEATLVVKFICEEAGSGEAAVNENAVQHEALSMLNEELRFLRKQNSELIRLLSAQSTVV